MGKIKTKKTLLKRIKITKNKKLVRGQIRTGHLKAKWGTDKKFRKARDKVVKRSGYKKKFKKLLGKHA